MTFWGNLAIVLVKENEILSGVRKTMFDGVSRFYTRICGYEYADDLLSELCVNYELIQPLPFDQ